MAEKSRWDPSTIPRHHTHEKRSPFKFRNVIILVVRLSETRMRIKTTSDLLKFNFTSFLVVYLLQIRMRTETVRAVQTSLILITHLSLWFVFNKHACALQQNGAVLLQLLSALSFL